MKTIERVVLIKCTLWLGILLDAVETVGFIVPGVFASMMNLTVADQYSFQVGLWLAAPVMLGWTLILLWAVRKPVERSGVLLCLLPVILGYMVVEGIGVQSGVSTLTSLLPTLAIQLLLITLVSISIILARTLQKHTPTHST